MKHLKTTLFCIASIFILTNNLYSQNENTEIKYSYAKKDLKEFLAIQGLLTENRTEDLKIFLDKNNYRGGNSGGKITFYKMDFNNMRKENEIYPVLTIKSGSHPKEWVDNSIEINFMKVVNGELSEGAFHNYSSAILIQELIKKNISIGQQYDSFKELKNMKDVKFEEIDRYTYRITLSNDKGDQERIFKASNFFQLNEMLLFSGPGKAAVTQLFFSKPIGEKNKYLSSMIIRSLRYNNPDEKLPFSIDFFMSLKNFNDRIWADN